jgi:hypothetical protein
MFLTERFQRLGDLAAGTMVVVEERPRGRKVPRVEDPGVKRLAALLPRRIEAGPELSRALSDYISHRPRFGRARREEMATPLARPLRRRYNLPDNAPADVVLCAVYDRVFFGE